MASSQRTRPTVVGRGSVLCGTYSVCKLRLSEEDLCKVRDELTFVPSTFGNAKPVPVVAYEEDDLSIVVPRFYGIQMFGIRGDTVDKRSRGSGGAGDELSFSGQLHAKQERAVCTCTDRLTNASGGQGGVLVAPCGTGKTVMGIAIISRLRLRTLVLVHKSFLVEQWQERLATFLPGARVGRLQQKTFEADADVCVGMIQSLASRQYEGLEGAFGLLIVDEAHHIAAPVFNRAVRKVSARCVLGLSATPERRDGLTKLMYWSLGGLITRLQQDSEPVRVVSLAYHGGARKEVKLRDGSLCVPKMLQPMAADRERNQMVAQFAATCVLEHNRHVIILCDLIAHLSGIEACLLADCRLSAREHVAWYVGSTKADARADAVTRPIILSTYRMASEGLDVSRLDTLVLASPKANVEQCVGRVQRPNADKCSPLVFDIVDTFSIFESMARKRQKHYASKKYSMVSSESIAHVLEQISV